MEGELDRRTFLRGMLKTAVIGAVATPALAELLEPKRTIFLPPRGGWPDNTVGSTATPQQIYDDIQRLFRQLTRPSANAGVPQFLTNYMDPKIIDILVTPARAKLLMAVR